MNGIRHVLLYVIGSLLVCSIIVNFIWVSLLADHLDFCRITNNPNSLINSKPQHGNKDSVLNNIPAELPENKTPDSKRSLVYGIDVSHYQGRINWDEVKAQGRVFSYFKATESLGVDTTFARHWRHSGRSDIIRGAYHFFNPNVSGAKQAVHYLNIVKSRIDDTSLPPALDVETAAVGNMTVEEYANNVLNWLEKVEQALKRTPVIYTNDYIGNKYLLGKEFEKYPLWVASPYLGSEFNPAHAKIPKAWKGFTFWQYSQKFDIKGIHHTVDHDVFIGTEQDLLDFIKSTHLSTN